MESGTIVKWLKSEGDAVEKGEPLYELDTDKVTQEVEADASGVLLKSAITEGEVEVGKTIAVIGEQGEKVEQLPEPPSETGAEEPRDEQPEAAKPPVRVESGPVESKAPSGNGRVKASPLARRIARERRIDLSAVAATGPDGPFVAEDVERTAASAAPAPPAVASQPIK